MTSSFAPSAGRPIGRVGWRRETQCRAKTVCFFAPAEHAYCVDGIRVPISVTGFLHSLSSEFDPNAAAQAMMEGPGWPEKQHNFMNADGTIKTADEIVDAWARNGEVQGARCALLH